MRVPETLSALELKIAKRELPTLLKPSFSKVDYFFILIVSHKEKHNTVL